jgi:small subunit ribosomal protein S7
MVKKTIKTYISYNLYTKFINHFIIAGRKSLIEKNICSVFDRLSIEFNLPVSRILLYFYKRLKTYVEIKKLKKGRRTFLVPIALKRHRRSFLSLFWLSESITLNNTRISFFEKLYSEMLKICLNQNCNTLLLLSKNNKQASKNRINLHYRW